MLWFCPLFFSRTCTNTASNFQLFTSYRRISPRPRHCLMVCSILSFCGEELLAPLPNPKLEEHPLSDVATAYSMYWQPPFIIKSFNFITSSCSLSPTVMRWTAFPFQGSSIVNRFLRRTDHSPNNEIFPMRPNNLTRCIFKTNVQNECWIRNKPNVYKHIHKHETNFKTTNQQRIKKATMYMRISTHSLTPERYKPCIADSGSGGTWKRTVGEVKGKHLNGEGTQHSSACASSVTTNNKNMRHFQHHCFRITLN